VQFVIGGLAFGGAICHALATRTATRCSRTTKETGKGRHFFVFFSFSVQFSSPTVFFLFCIILSSQRRERERRYGKEAEEEETCCVFLINKKKGKKMKRKSQKKRNPTLSCSFLSLFHPSFPSACYFSG